MKRKKGKILVVDDNEGILKSLKFALKYEFEEVEAIKNPNLIPSLLRTRKFDIILLDMNFSAGVNSGNEGIFWLREIFNYDQDAVVVLITAYGDIELAVRAVKEGATDFILKPWDDEKLLATLQSAYKLRQTKVRMRKNEPMQVEPIPSNIQRNTLILGESEEIKQVLDVVNKVGNTDANVLILGENGTGKELIARELHCMSPRTKETFLTVDIASLSENLVESELFGHVKGAFTDAYEERKGRFELASGGTLFLDEIGNLSLASQSKILTALQNRRITPIGSNSSVEIDFRLISATNKPLRQLVRNQEFREDLLFRLNTIEINIPPLRDRGNDVLLLAEHFLEKFAQKYNKTKPGLHKLAKEKLLKYHWPGNIRELQHTMEKAIILNEADILEPDNFVFHYQEPEEEITDNSLKLEDVEKKAIEKALSKNKGNLSNTAKELGITRKTLYSKIEKYGI
jgi:DNA-binding NtrC family response regulator